MENIFIRDPVKLFNGGNMKTFIGVGLLTMALSFTLPLYADNTVEQNYQNLQQQIQQLKKDSDAQLAQLKTSIDEQIQQIEKEIRQLGATNAQMIQNLKTNFESQLQQTQKNTEQQITELKKQMDSALSDKKTTN